jgi:hypothetical protein
MLFFSSSFPATNTSYYEHENDIWQPMNNNNRILYENASATLPNNYHFQPIDHDFSSISPLYPTNNSQLIQRPIPMSNHHSNTVTERPKSQQQYVLQTKRNSTVNINSSDTNPTMRSYGLPRSITSDHLANTTNRSYHYPSVQDVLDALNRRSFDRESYV